MRLTCWTRSAVSVSRSRLIRRRSSSCGAGALTIAHTRGSPRLEASRARTRASPSILSVFARRRRREVAMEAGSTTWLSIPSCCRTRWIQNPSSPASWMTMMGKTCPVRARAFSLSWDKRARRAAMSPLGTACFDIFSPPPGAREVMTQVERLSSSETKIALRSVRIAACSLGRGQRACMVAPEWVVQHPHSAREQGATNRTHGISTRIVTGLSIGSLTAGMIAPRVGRAIQTHGGRLVMATGTVLLALGLLGLSLAPSLPLHLLAWVVIGGGMGCSLYDAAFSTLGRLYGQEARRAIATLTLFGGFASTICWPISAFFLERNGWAGPERVSHPRF